MVHHPRLALGAERRLLVGELVDRLGFLAVRHAGYDTRHDKVDEARVFAVAEATPLRVLGRLEDLGQVARLGQFRPIIEAEHAGPGRRNERRKRTGGDIGHQAQCLDVVRVAAPLVVADQRTVRLSARCAELVLVDLLEELALVELDGPRQVAVEFALAHIEHA